MTDKHLLLLDCSGFAYRAYHVGVPVYRSDGLPTWGILGFMRIVWHILGAAQADPPHFAAAVFDAPGANFRHKLFPKYKANRDPNRAEELGPQLPYLRHAAEALGLVPVEAKGYEADDVIATLAAMANKAGVRVTIVSSDKDFGQCVADGEVEIVDPMSRKRALAEDVRKKFGVLPPLVPHVQALAGDTVDGIPGIAGCGYERAGALVRRFGDLEGVLANADKCRWPQVRRGLKRDADKARLYLKLTTLRRNVKLGIDLESLRVQPVMRSHVLEILKVLEASPRMEEIFSFDPKIVRIVPHVEDAYEWWQEELRAPGQPIPETPQCGFYQRRLVKGGMMVPARIWREPETDIVTGEPTGNDRLRCEVGGHFHDPVREWDRLPAHPIKESEYKYEKADGAHAKRWRPSDPKSQPTKAVDFATIPTPVYKPKRKKK